jgi:hypothetical protein
MLAEWNVELGADDPQLDIPWSSPDGACRFLDLKRQPELLLEVSEACFCPELAEFLNWINSSSSPFESAKCDVWTSRQISAEEEIFGEPCKFCSYVDFLFADVNRRSHFEATEGFAQRIARLLRVAPEMGTMAEFTVRRCHDYRGTDKRPAEGHYITFYLHGYGNDEQQARKRWAIALKVVQHAIIQQCASKFLK